MGWLLSPLEALGGARGQLFGWCPVFLSLGIGAWFALPLEPLGWHYALAAALLLVTLVGKAKLPEIWHPLLVALAAVLAGFLACGLRLASIDAPVLAGNYRGPVQGRVIEIDRSQSDALRLVLDQVVMRNLPPAQTPKFVRISLQRQEPEVYPGEIILLTANLGPPGGPVEPGAFDFQRMAFFDRLGAVGYTSDPLMLWEEADPDEQWINRLRAFLGEGIRRAVPGDSGAFAAGAMTGDRSGIRGETVDDLRDSNLAHLLAISGQNMAFLTIFVFALFRYGIALVPPVALRINAKKLAAVAAFGVAAFYLLLSGANVATERAFLMVTVMLGAVLLDRRALTLRSVAISGLLVLLWQPEELLEPGFQLSFAATVVLIAGFHALDGRKIAARFPAWTMTIYITVLSAVLAGAATAPFAAAHFNRFTDYGLLANILTGPAMLLLMGAGAVAALLAPIGLAPPALWLMGQASAWILAVAKWISELDGSVTPIVAPAAGALPLITLAGIWLIVWPGRWRFAAALPMILGLMIWACTERPAILIAGDARLVGLMGPEGRALSQTRGAGFAAETWLENDGDLAIQVEAADRPGFNGSRYERWFRIGEIVGVSLTGKYAAENLEKVCGKADLVITTAPLEGLIAEDCVVIDPARLAETGALAGNLQGDLLILQPARDSARAWRGGGAVASVLVITPRKARLVTNLPP
jgi:competence protein ComEC